MTSADAAALVRAYAEEGRTLAQCAAEFGIAHRRASSILRAQDVAAILREHGVTIRGTGGLRATRADPAALASAYTGLGWTLTRCGQHFGITPKRAAAILREHGVTIRRRGGKTRQPAARP